MGALRIVLERGPKVTAESPAMREAGPPQCGQSSPGQTSLKSETERILMHLRYKFGLELMPIINSMKKKMLQKGNRNYIVLWNLVPMMFPQS